MGQPWWQFGTINQISNNDSIQNHMNNANNSSTASKLICQKHVVGAVAFAPLLNRDYHRDPYIKALERRGELFIRGLTLNPTA